ncbi:DUF6502 family protein [Pseudophaeobacter sp.]|uniref:DUF6502 family protein n=1 Tax=Pseudophaeobacter sp. TaxID=1971739 RepID=UPI0026231A99|nr:DUF6502 family protein [Pseudophaeobacter sp.]
MHWLDHIFRPLARLAVQRGCLFPAVERRLRRAYLEAAKAIDGDETTDSKISIKTGLQRRDIARLRSESDPPEAKRQPLAEIIALWWGDPAYDPEGIPTQGDGASFTSLARRIRKDVHPRTFLNILIENGTVSEIGERVSLNTRSYRPPSGSGEQLAYLADNVGDHLAAAVSNVVEEGTKYDMAVHYKGLSANAISQLDQHFRTRMEQTLEELDTMARGFPASEDGLHRFRAGGFFFDDSDCEANIHDP